MAAVYVAGLWIDLELQGYMDCRTKMYSDKVLLKLYIKVHCSFVEAVFCVLEHKVQTHIRPWSSDKVHAELGTSLFGHLMEVIVCVFKHKLHTHTYP